MAYRCSRCGNETDDFRLLCPWCGAWMALRRQVPGGGGEAQPVSLPGVTASTLLRVKTGIGGLDALLGGGFVAGSSLLVTGPPGAGKSTLLLQVIDAARVRALYVSGEETLQQIKLRADRLSVNSEKIALLFEPNLGGVISHIRDAPPGLLVIDSIQTVYTDFCDSPPGSVAQIRRCTFLLRRLAQEKGIVLLLVGQVTKGLRAAGPKLLEHTVDGVLSLEASELAPQVRTLCVVKHRHGPAGCFISFTMSAGGFQLKGR